MNLLNGIFGQTTQPHHTSRIHHANHGHSHSEPDMYDRSERPQPVWRGGPAPPKSAPPVHSKSRGQEQQPDALGGSSAHAHGTGYYPANNRMEGGTKDRRGHKLNTLQDYLAGKAPYVSVAMDSKAAPYGQKLRIPELEQKYGRPIDFRVVDTGGAFRGRGTSRIDICTGNSHQAHDPTINGPLTLDFE